MINWKEFANLNFWFDPRPAFTLKFFTISASFVIFLLLLAGFFLWWNKVKIGKYPPKNKFFQGVFWWLLGLQIFGFFLIVFRSLGLRLLSARFFWIIFLIVSVFILIFNLYIYFKKVPQKIKIYEAYLLKRKYLPK